MVSTLVNGWFKMLEFVFFQSNNNIGRFVESLIENIFFYFFWNDWNGQMLKEAK
jgi:hypothetical protein